MLSDLIKSVLLIVVAFLLRAALQALGIELDEATFNVIVAGIVGYILMLLGYEGIKRFVNKSRPGLLK